MKRKQQSLDRNPNEPPQKRRKIDIDRKKEIEDEDDTDDVDGSHGTHGTHNKIQENNHEKQWRWGVDDDKPRKKTKKKKPEKTRTDRILQKHHILFKRKSQYIISKITSFSTQYAFVINPDSNEGEGTFRIEWEHIYLIIHWRFDYKPILINQDVDPVSARLVHVPDTNYYIKPFECSVLNDVEDVNVLYDFQDDESERVTLPNEFHLNQSVFPSMIAALNITDCQIYKMMVQQKKEAMFVTNILTHFETFPDPGDDDDDDDLFVLNKQNKHKEDSTVSTNHTTKPRQKEQLKLDAFFAPITL